MKPIGSVDYIVIHRSDSPDKRDIGAKEITKWHVEERGWQTIGYHYIIRRNGKIEFGRPEQFEGAHCKGVNDRSLGVCLIGRRAFDIAQFISLKELVDELKQRYPKAKVRPHNSFPSAIKQKKTCPGFDLAAVLDKRLLT